MATVRSLPTSLDTPLEDETKRSCCTSVAFHLYALVSKMALSQSQVLLTHLFAELSSLEDLRFPLERSSRLQVNCLVLCIQWVHIMCSFITSLNILINTSLLIYINFVDNKSGLEKFWGYLNHFSCGVSIFLFE